MRTLSDTLARLSAYRMPAMPGAPLAGPDRLTDLADFGSNPGALRARCYVPADLPAGAPLVVVMHGCTQTAAGYDHGTGWSDLADRHGFALLFPEQQRANNANLCFNWFVPGDIARDGGEALSIRQMVERVVVDRRIDRARIYATGLSAGGAMTAVMLATYPDLFAGGAIIAGLPYGTATTMAAALDRMRAHRTPAPDQLQALVRGASPHDGPWPTLSVWHGSADHTVDQANADALIAQWRTLHGVAAAPTRTETVDGHPREIWCDADGRAVIEAYRIAGMGHGTPLDPAGEDGCGAHGAYMLDVGICSTRHIASFWGLTGRTAAARPAPRVKPAPRHAPAGDSRAAAAHRLPLKLPSLPKTDVAKVIEDALRAAGLMR